MLELEGVSYRYAGAAGPSIHDVNLRIGEGEVVGLCGPSESGKTTVCLVASGLAPRAIRGTLGGRLVLDGADVTGWPMHELVSRVGICFQDPTTQLSGVSGTVYEEVAFGPMNLALPREEIVARTNEALDALRIADLAERDPTRLSGGQMQLVAIAGLLAMRPAHLVLDEPTAELDPAGSALVGDAIRRLAGEGRPILIAEQRTDLLAQVCDRVLVLREGRVALEGAAAEVLADPRLRELGVPEPSAVRLRRRVEEAGLDPGRIERVLREAAAARADATAHAQAPA
jgi:energy-coupling factor transport system ATP-binding protein